MTIIDLPEIDSTNTYVARNVSDLAADTVVNAESQVAGRGQRGNSWEAEPFRNLTFSILLRPKAFPAISQFAISQAVALAIVAAVDNVCGVRLKIKWPNDIYFKDRKICGILIEHAVMGREIMHTIVGIGLNVNQRQFFSDAPNPVSLWQILGCEIDRHRLLTEICERIISDVPRIMQATNLERLHAEYMKNLWRNDGYSHPFRDTATNEVFDGVVESIEPTGLLSIRQADNGNVRRYAFKEVEWIL